MVQDRLAMPEVRCGKIFQSNWVTALDEAEIVLNWGGRPPDKRRLLQSAEPVGTGTLHMLQRAAQCSWDTNEDIR